MKHTATSIEQLTVTCTRDLVSRIAETFHKGPPEQKNEIKDAFHVMTLEMFNDGVPHAEQCKQLLQVALDGLSFNLWPKLDERPTALSATKVR